MKISTYRTIAKNALMSWNGLSEEEASQVVENSNFENLENQVWAKTSIKSAVFAISAYLNLNNGAEFESAVLGQDNPEMTDKQENVLNEVAKKARDVDVADMTIYALKCIHDGWVVDNAKKFVKEGREAKKYQHLPLEMIGWKEATADLLFLEPILNDIGLEVNKDKLKSAYLKETKVFFKENNLVDKNFVIDEAKVASTILKGKEFYPALNEVNSAKDMKEAKMMAGQVVEKTGDLTANLNR
ncbi:MAG: hypothetical protein ACI4R8_03205 [Candidatus Caccovivens sp.]